MRVGCLREFDKIFAIKTKYYNSIKPKILTILLDESACPSRNFNQFIRSPTGSSGIIHVESKHNHFLAKSKGVTGTPRATERKISDTIETAPFNFTYLNYKC